MSVCAIMQPTYLPWLGYFDLADQADVFVFLDDVQFARRSWQQRNRIKTPSGLAWLTVPVRVGGRVEQLIRDVELAADASFPRDHVRSVELNYRRTPHFGPHAEDFAATLRDAAATGRLVDVNVALIAWLADRLQVTTTWVRSSELAVDGRRSERLLAICRSLGATTYLAAPGSLAYLADDAAQFADAGVEVAVHAYEHPVYSQAFPPFQAYASAIDALFNLGNEASACLRSGRRPWSSLSDPPDATSADPEHASAGSGGVSAGP